MRLGPDGCRGSAPMPVVALTAGDKFIDVVPKLIQALQLMPALARKVHFGYGDLCFWHKADITDHSQRYPLLGGEADVQSNRVNVRL